MTMRTWGRVVPFGVVDIVVGTSMFMAAPLNLSPKSERESEIAGDPQALEGILGFVVERAAGAFRHLGLFELGQDFLDGGRVRDDGEGDVGIAERAVALA